MISAALAAFLVLHSAIEPSKPAQPRSAVATAPPQQKELTPAVLDRLERLSKMSSEDRAQALADLPPVQRSRIEKGLERLDALTPQQRDQWFIRYRTFNGLDNKQQEAVRTVVKEFLSLPVTRRKAVRQELESYKQMPMWARESRMRSTDFKNKFSPEERQIVHRSAILLPDRSLRPQLAAR